MPAGGEPGHVHAGVEGRFSQAVALCEGGLAHVGVSNAAVQLTLQASRAYARIGYGCTASGGQA